MTMWLEDVRSAWVPTQSLMMVVALPSFSLGAFGVSLISSLCIVSGLGHLLVKFEDLILRYDNDDTEEVKQDRRVLWGSLGFQMVWCIGLACCWIIGWGMGTAANQLHVPY
mmetsp:Transcript_18468/g.26061  ORF Transcript_18468/g.26061 Transcript_18468/m.26061 type:complete len:111 (+) Transcript_18468:47-379(+)